jgi:hypothetical protein
MPTNKLPNRGNTDSSWEHATCLTPIGMTRREEAGEQFRIQFGIGAATSAMIGMTSLMQLDRFIHSCNRFRKAIIALSILLSAMICRGQVDNFQLDFASGLSLSTNVEVASKIPKSHLKRLPQSLPVFRYSDKPRLFSTNGLQVLLDQSAFAETNIAECSPGTNFGFVFKNEKNPPDVFSVNPLRGDIRIENIEREAQVPQSDTVPNFNEIRAQLLKLTGMIGITTNEMEPSTNGTVKMTFADTKTSKWSGVGMKRVNFISSREAEIQRGVNGCSAWLFDDKIAVKYGVDNRLLKLSIHWPGIEPVRTNRLFTVAELIGKIKKNQALTDATDIPGSDVTGITLKDVEIQYYYRKPSGFRGIAPDKSDIYPVAAFLATFKSKSGQTEDAGIYLPILKSP